MYEGPVIDPDVHHNWADPAEVIAFLPEHWRAAARGGAGEAPQLEPPYIMWPYPMGTGRRLDAYPDNGVPGSDYQLMREQLLDPHNVAHVVLSFEIGVNPALPNPYFAGAVVSAVNDWTIDRWLEHPDQRLCGALLAPTQLPEEGAREIRRVGAHPRFVEVLLLAHTHGRPFGHPVYHPLYEAAVEFDLPIAIHIGGDLAGGLPALTAGGMPGTQIEFHSNAAQGVQHDLASFITHGVFEKYPSLRLLLIETGVSWVPWVLWNLDRAYPLLRRESPWVKRPPSEYFFERVRMTTQPLDETEDKDDLMEILEAVGGMEDVLCYASDYPHWDTDVLQRIERRIPDAWHSKLFYENAARTLRLPTPSPAGQGRGH